MRISDWSSDVCSSDLREQYNRFKVFGRYSMDVMEFFSISTRAKGWVVTFMKMFWRYWTALSTRKLTARARRFTLGAAMTGWLYKKVFDRKIEVRPNKTGRTPCRDRVWQYG